MYVLPATTVLLPSVQSAKLYPVRVSPVPSATVNVSPVTLELSVGTEPLPPFAA